MTGKCRIYIWRAAMLVQGSWVIGEINGRVPEIEEICGVSGSLLLKEAQILTE